MAFPTSVNGQITDSVTQASVNGTDVAFAERILQVSNAFAKSLQAQDRVFHEKLNGIVNMALEAVERLSALHSSTAPAGIAPDAVKSIAAAAQDALHKAQAPEMPAIPEATADDAAMNALEAGAVQALVQSYQNAVNAQQQANVTMQAAVTLLVSAIVNSDLPVLKSSSLATTDILSS